MKKGDEQKPADELKMPANEFDRIMRGAVGVPAPVGNPRPERQPRKGGRSAKK
jgi:hypothetical protein